LLAGWVGGASESLLTFVALLSPHPTPPHPLTHKLVEIRGEPRIKLSEDVEKVVIPGRKTIYRLFGQEGHPVMDIIQRVGEQAPEVGKRIMCRHPFEESKRANVTPARVEELLHLVFDGTRGPDKDVVILPLPSLTDTRAYVLEQIANMRKDHLRHLNPTAYKLATSPELYDFMHRLWLDNAPISDIV